ncbi:MAG TPA: hypothetical protein VHJ20_04850 [Polyangia bacterium]|nr:hypothetical protein [Polyangia bacterium]
MSSRRLATGLAASLLALAPAARAQNKSADAGAPLTDHREILVPVPAGSVEVLRIDNPMGRVDVRGSSKIDAIHVVADKRAATPEALGRLRVHYAAFQNGEVQIDTRVELQGGERSVPLSGSGIDLVVEVPPDVAIEAKTFGGDVTATGLHAGARLETTGGRIGVSDVSGGVVTRQLRGGQHVAGVEGDVDLDGVEGDLDLQRLAGGRVDARVVDGSIRAEDVRSTWVRLRTTTGQIVLLGVIRPGARYDLRSYAGDVRVVAMAAPPPFELRARSAAAVESAYALRAAGHQGDWTRAFWGNTGNGTRAALLEVSAVLGRVVIQPPTTADLH